MQISLLPSVDGEYKNRQGDAFIVIGCGTQGIIIEYADGRIELISQQHWLDRAAELTLCDNY